MVEKKIGKAVMEQVIYKLFQTLTLITVQLLEDVWDSFCGYLSYIFVQNYSLLKGSDWVVQLSMMREASPRVYLQLDLKSCILHVHSQYLHLSSCYVQFEFEGSTLLWFFFQPFPEDKKLFEQGNPRSFTYWWNQGAFMSHCLFHPTYLFKIIDIW